MKNYLYILLGSFIFALSVAWIASPLGLVSGGVSGIGIVIKEITGSIPIALTSFVLNVPLFSISFIERGARFIAKSLFAFLSLTFFLGLFELAPSPFTSGDLFALSLVYGVLAGFGLGLVLRAGATSGGTDMLAAIIKRKRKHLKISVIILVIDVVIIFMGVFLFGVTKGVYAVLSLVVSVKVIDVVISGVKTCKEVFIITQEDKKISQRVMTELERGITRIEGTGLYTGSNVKILFSVVSSRELTKLREIVYESDFKAFVTVSDAGQVLGQGFENLFPSGDKFD